MKSRDAAAVLRWERGRRLVLCPPAHPWHSFAFLEGGHTFISLRGGGSFSGGGDSNIPPSRQLPIKSGFRCPQKPGYQRFVVQRVRY